MYHGWNVYSHGNVCSPPGPPTVGGDPARWTRRDGFLFSGSRLPSFLHTLKAWSFDPHRSFRGLLELSGFLCGGTKAKKSHRKILHGCVALISISLSGCSA